MSEEQKVQMIPISEIVVPDIRVTSQFDPAIELELAESLKAMGIQQPLQCIKVNNQYWLVDGLHRAKIAAKLGMKEVPVIVRDGTQLDVLTANLAVNRMRGKSNPIQEGQVLRALIEEEKMTTTEACKRIGLSEKWGRQLVRLTTLPEDVQVLIKSGKLSVGSAVQISALPDVAEQISVANDTISFNYTVDQTKQRVRQLIDQIYEPEPGGYVFTPQGGPRQVPYTCYVCDHEMGSAPKYIYVCDGCQKVFDDLKRQYAQPPPPPQPPTSIELPGIPDQPLENSPPQEY